MCLKREEKKFDTNVAAEVTKLMGKVNLESEQVTASIDEVYKGFRVLLTLTPTRVKFTQICSSNSLKSLMSKSLV